MFSRFLIIGIASISALACSTRVSHAPGVPEPAAAFGARSPSASLAPLPSPGCHLPPERRTHSEHPGWTAERALSSGGHTRRFLLSVPEGDQPHPLVFNLHGLMESAELQQIFSKLQGPALARGYVVVHPQGLGISWNAGACCGRAKDEQVDDVRFFRDLVAQLGREMCLDLRRVYATGMSNGGFMSYRLACDASDLFAAVAPVAAVDGNQSCEPRRAVPVLAINGTHDILVPYDGRKRDEFLSVGETLARWSALNRCTVDAKPIWQNGDATCVAPARCSGSGDLVFCAIDGGGHTWPGGLRAPYLGHTSYDLDASDAILDFFDAHARE